MSDAPLLEVVPHESATIIAIKRRTLDEATSTRLVDDVSNLVGTESRPVVLDFSKVEFVPSSALGALVRLAQTLRLSGTRLMLVNLDRRIRGSLTVTRLDKVLEIKHTLEDALYVLKSAS